MRSCCGLKAGMEVFQQEMVEGIMDGYLTGRKEIRASLRSLASLGS